MPARTAAFAGLLAAAVGGLPVLPAQAQSLTVLPVTIQLPPGQMAGAVTVINQGDAESAFQIRAFAWSQPRGETELAPTDALLVSPPLGTIAPRASQVVRLVLRRPAQDREASYRILLDQLPPPAAPGTVRVALRLSIPVFAEPTNSPIAPRLRWRIESEGGQAYLTVANEGTRHEAVRDIALAGGAGPIRIQGDASPYVLPGATRRWRLLTRPPPGGNLRLTARADAGPIDEAVPVNAGR
ncbi:molecular chaperone [Roseomonas hellenica]|uniref:Molecular chaperone n=1 Tax=Plastoroseomonas hellenica TaxID=2687306 RepID=A0ABS5F4F1_9PROT|nr:fimbria/pilus periplasmic chaperone [Plastoroseomonas hellenica]MBR0667020.1 molecular chaperone [Plastoroseomonas hellenica]